MSSGFHAKARLISRNLVSRDAMDGLILIGCVISGQKEM